MINSRLKILQDNEIKKIHYASLDILNDIGVKIDDIEIKEKLQDLGCKIENDRVKFKSELINKVLKNVKKEFVMEGRSSKSIKVKAGNIFSHSFGAVSNILDIKTGIKRDAKLSDLINSIKLMNRLDSLDMGGPMLYPTDIPPQISQIKMAEQVLKYSEKPARGPGVSSSQEAKYIVELFNLFTDRKSQNYIGTLAISPESPLYYPKDIIETMKIIVSAGIPTVMLVAPIAGLTAPITLAGILTQMNASMLAFATISNIINPDTPLLYGSRLSFANMKKGFSIWGLPEMGITGAISAQLASYYGFPSSVYGLSTTSCTFDNQAGYEKAVNGILPALAGANLISGFGGLASNTVASYEQLVIDNETFNSLLKAVRVLQINEDTLALDVIKDVVNDGNFLEQEHTLRHLRAGEVFIPEIGFDSLWNDWELKGKPTIRENAQKYALKIIEEDECISLPDEINKEMNSIVNAAYKELVVRD